MVFNAGCWRLLLAVLVIGASWLTGCATASFDGRSGVCPPVMEYSRELQERAAIEVEALSPDTVIAGWLADYAVMRDQARACR
jgi:hypothetical protein